jgi:hypothetical protein
MVSVLLIFGALLAVACWLAFRAAARQLNALARVSTYEARLTAVRDLVAFEAALLGDRISDSDRWLALQILGNTTYYSSSVGLRTRREDLDRRAAETSRARTLFLRELARALRGTHQPWLRRSYNDLLVHVWSLACENSGRPCQPVLAQTRGHAEPASLRILVPSAA